MTGGRAARTIAERIRQSLAPMVMAALALAPAACTGDNPLFVAPGSVTGGLPDAHDDVLFNGPPSGPGTGGLPATMGQTGGGSGNTGGTSSGAGGAGPSIEPPPGGPDADVSADTRPGADTSPGAGGAGAGGAGAGGAGAGGAGGAGTAPNPDAGAPVVDTGAPLVDAGGPVLDTRPPVEASPPVDVAPAVDTAALMHGLSGTYYEGKNFEKQAFTRVDQIINFTWGNGSPGAPLPVDNFSVRWSGFIEPYETGVYTFNTESDDGIRVSIGGRPVISAWVDQTAGEHTGQATLTAGVRTPIEIEYYERAYTATARLYWKGPTTPLEIVPRSQLWTY